MTQPLPFRGHRLDNGLLSATTERQVDLTERVYCPMDPRHLYMDERLKGGCVYCGADPDTREHVPSRIFLDAPLPSDLPVVPACSSCNASFSLDEEYFACLLECIICGSVDAHSLHRDKIRRSLSRNAGLVSRIQACRNRGETNSVWRPEVDRIRNIVVKLAQGHVAYELYPVLDPPSHVECRPLMSMSAVDREAFETASEGGAQPSPEIGTRAFLRVWVGFGTVYDNGDWVVVQPGRYRYAVNEAGGILVRMVFSEYLACTVAWT